MLSVVICSHNRSALLADTLASFMGQPDLDDHDFELVVVDNASTDATAPVVAAWTDDPRVRYVHEATPGHSHARNRGLAEARGDIVAWLDDDLYIDPGWMTQLLRCYRETDAAAVGGRAYLVYEGAPPAWLGPDFRRMLSEVEIGPQRIVGVPPNRLFGLNVSMRRDWLDRVGGFDPQLGHRGETVGGGEETHALRQIEAAGGRLVYEPSIVVGHRTFADRLHYEWFLKRAAQAGRNRAALVADAGLPVRARAYARNVAKLAGYAAVEAALSLRTREDYWWRTVHCRRAKIAAELEAMRGAG